MALTNADRDKRTYNDVYEKKDENGNVVDKKVLSPGTEEYKQAEEARNGNDSGFVIHKKDGSWVSAEDSASISLNAKTGKITVNAPSMAIKNENFQKSLKPALEIISQNYKANPNYKYALMNNSSETKTSVEWLD